MRCGIDSDEEELEDVAFCSFLFSGGAARKKKMSRPDVVLKRGMLVKRGNFIKTWNRHAFVLTSKELRWYGSSGEKGTPKGSIRLKDITKLRQKADGAFKIVTPSREHILVAPSDTLKREWMKAIHKAQVGTAAFLLFVYATHPCLATFPKAWVWLTVCGVWYGCAAASGVHSFARRA